ncbi:MAG: VacJ family lipoprotein [Deltaproteobacteria bacterium]|nr:VacJ family lipoprotein [Deltaproteobacteria bacterium]
MSKKKLPVVWISFVLLSFFIAIGPALARDLCYLEDGPGRESGAQRTQPAGPVPVPASASEERRTLCDDALRPFVCFRKGTGTVDIQTGGAAEGSGGALLLAMEKTGKEPMGEEPPAATISDPLEPINRAFFHFNDKLYFWLLEPAARGYRAVVPEHLRVGVGNMFYNLGFPIRFVNCLFQGKFEGACMEFTRFMVNSMVGMGGFIDIASQNMQIKRYEEDLGQTLGTYGLGPAFYINWPILGPSSLRDTVGAAGDAFLDPLNYMATHSKYRVSVKAYDTVNATSLRIGEYEKMKKAALDPYIALREAFAEHRQSKVEE